MELLTSNTAKTKLKQNTDSQETTNILIGNQQERYFIDRNEGETVGKNEKNEVNSMIENCERRNQTDKNPSDTERLAMEQIVLERFDDKVLEEKPFIQMEEKQLCEGSLEVTTNEDVDVIAKDMLSFAWQIARGMVCDDQSI